MRKFVNILMAASLMGLGACSMNPAQKEPLIKLVTKVEKPLPPVGLTEPCETPSIVDFTFLRDIVNDRQAWINAFDKCNARYLNLIDWNLGKK